MTQMTQSAAQTDIKVLDHGHVQLVDYMGSDLSVVNAARVSFNKESSWDGEQHWSGNIIDKKLSEKDQKLIKYLAKHNHFTPFCHPQISVRIKCPIFVRAQLGKHQVGLVMNEVSRRYVTFDPEIYTPMWRSAPTDGAKQGSSGAIEDMDLCIKMRQEYDGVAKECIDLYNRLLADGVAPEQARSILPQGTYTEFVWTGSLYAFARVYNLRIDAHSQWEIQKYAEAINKIVEPLFPVSWKNLTTK
ncbi:MAG: FAD-dependent thymidylate synthase [Magnetococcus sp. WYHC-3]